MEGATASTQAAFLGRSRVHAADPETLSSLEADQLVLMPQGLAPALVPRSLGIT